MLSQLSINTAHDNSYLPHLPRPRHHLQHPHTNIIPQPQIRTTRPHRRIPSDDIRHRHPLLLCHRRTRIPRCHQIEGVAVTHHPRLCRQWGGHARGRGGNRCGCGGGSSATHSSADIVPQPESFAAGANARIPRVEAGKGDAGAGGNGGAGVGAGYQVERVAVAGHSGLDWRGGSHGIVGCSSDCEEGGGSAGTGNVCCGEGGEEGEDGEVCEMHG